VGSTLLRPFDPLDDDEVFAAADTRFSTPSYWIGADDLVDEGIVRWHDGTPIPWVYSNWDVPDSPNNYQGGEHCLELQIVADTFTGVAEWNDVTCGSTRHYVCDGVDDGEPVPQSCHHADGSDGVHRVLCEALATWDNAQAACAGFGGSLARVDSAEANAAICADVTAHFTAPDDVFLGGRDSAVEGVWRWLDGDLFEDVR
jgi:hypothetical protein